MTAKLNPNPNDASSDKWRLFFEGLDLILFSQKVTGFDIPDISSMGIRGPSPDPILFDAHGDRVEFSPVNFIFVVDENYANYKKLFEWLKTNAGKNIPVTRNFTVELLDNRGKQQNVTLEFQHGRPTALGSFQLDTTAETPTLLCTLTMNFQDMNFI
ncbi:tail completion protein [Vibrio phage VAP7]|uniref:Tail completion protein n=2 Tax=Vapseptimavirus VAP7 TaxID=2841303 RepID=A0A4Y5TVF1_9CAUD|nr:tail completion protein [Vibrio phage VAP7]AWY10155.1 tail completion protein [Vibrio phage VP-1]QDB73341.1 tail completion protein [Vibrio phage VAP7]